MNILQGFLSKARNALSEQEITQPLLEQVTETLGTEIAPQAADRRHLTQAIARARQYFEGQAESLPGPVALYQESSEQDPLLSLLFSSSNDIRHALGRSMEMRDALPKLNFGGRPYPYAYALMGMRGKPDRITPGPLPVFADHTLALISPSEEDVRGRLADAAFARVLKQFDEHVLRLRQKEKLLRSEWNIENVPASGHAGANDYVFADQELTPGNMLRGLLAWLGRPQEHLRVSREKPVVIDTPGNGHAPVHLELPTLLCADRRQWLTCIVKFPTQEAAEATAQESHPHRYIFV